MQKSTVILYHANCPDGFTAAWAAWKKYKNKAEYIPVKHHVPPPKNLKDKGVFLLDFCYDTETIKRLMQETKRFVILDHHATAQKEISEISRNNGAKKQWGNEIVFDNNHSGAYLAWRHFHPKKPLPWLVRYVEDNDLWRFKLPHSKDLTLFIDAHDLDFTTWNKIARLLENSKTRRACAEKGNFVRRFASQIIKDVSGSATKVKFAGHTVLAANSTVLRSEIGHELAKKRPPFSIIWREKGGQIIVSLRSDGTFDVAKIAEKYGGGGHKSAAGFTLKQGEKIPWRT